jgi:hypothetical protein
MRFAWLCLLAGAACGGDMPPQDPPPTALPKAAASVVEEAPVALPAPDGKLSLAALSEAERGPSEDNGRRRIGLHRDLPQSLPGTWAEAEAGERVWRLRIQSSEAVALRLHFTEFHVGDGAVTVFEASEELRPAVERRYSGDGPGGDGEFWSDLLEGDSAIIEYRPPPGDKGAGQPPFRIAEISHLWQSPLDAF